MQISPAYLFWEENLTEFGLISSGYEVCERGTSSSWVLIPAELISNEFIE
jgi:hypothetical protein